MGLKRLVTSPARLKGMAYEEDFEMKDSQMMLLHLRHSAYESIHSMIETMSSIGPEKRLLSLQV